MVSTSSGRMPSARHFARTCSTVTGAHRSGRFIMSALSLSSSFHFSPDEYPAAIAAMCSRIPSTPFGNGSCRSVRSLDRLNGATMKQLDRVGVFDPLRRLVLIPLNDRKRVSVNAPQAIQVHPVRPGVEHTAARERPRREAPP